MDIFSMASNYKTVYSTDPKDFCPKCKELSANCKCVKHQIYDLSKLMVIFRLESNGRGGKTVTVMDGLPKNEPLLKELTKEIKTRCGTGGTYKMDDKFGKIEIQGDKREPIKRLLDAKQIKYKGM